jgi:4-hydroxy-4-methyl-2-oxoglutarate aldolase
MSPRYDELRQLGTATVYEAAGRQGMVDLDLTQVIPGSRGAGPARTVLCGDGDNLMVHAVIERIQPGDVVVITSPQPAPYAVVGDLLATQILGRGAEAVLVDASVRDVEDLRELGLPIWARWVRVRGADKNAVGELDVPVDVGGVTVNPGDAVVLDADGVVVVPAARVDEVVAAGHERVEREAEKRAKLQAGGFSYDLDNLRSVVEGGGR